MINQEKLQLIEDAINSRPCDVCGKQHHLKLRQNSTHSFATSSTVNVLFPTGDLVVVEVDDDSCDGFAMRVANFVRSKGASLITLPFDMI